MGMLMILNFRLTIKYFAGSPSSLPNTSEEFPFSIFNHTLLLVIIIISVLFLNVLMIGTAVIICRWIFKRIWYLKKPSAIFISRLKNRRKEAFYIPRNQWKCDGCISNASLLRSTSTRSEQGSYEAEQDLVAPLPWKSKQISRNTITGTHAKTIVGFS